MILTSKTAKISTSSDAFNWGSSLVEDKIFVLLEVKGDETSPANINGKKILEFILQKLIDFKEKNLETIVELLRSLKKKQCIKTIIIGFLQEDNLFLGTIGNGVVWMSRGEKIGRVLSSYQVSKGKVRQGDVLLFCSESFDQFLKEEKRRQLFKIKDPEEMTETIIPSLLSDSKLKGVTVLVVSITSAPFKKQSVNFLSQYHLPNKKLGQIVSRISSFIKLGKPPHLSSFDSQQSRSKKTLLTISVILIILLIISIFFNIGHRKNTIRSKKINDVLNLVTHQYEEAVGLIDLNAVRARELLASSKLSLASLLAEIPKKSEEYRQINEWMEKIAAAEITAYKIYKLTAVPVFFDLNLIKQGGQGDLFSSYKEKKAILDKKNKVVYFLATNTKQSAIMAGSEVVEDAQTISLHGNNIYILNSKGIVSIDISSKTSKTVISKDDQWGQIMSLAAFAGNIYLLDITNSIVWKYIATDFGFSGRYSYFNPDVRVDLKNASQLVIDGAVWVVVDKKQILKFSKGLGEQFAFKGLADTIEEIVSISTSDVDKNLYLLDKKTKRILVFDKAGDYQSQYQWDGLNEASDISASEEEGKIFVLAGSKIYAIDLK